MTLDKVSLLDDVQKLLPPKLIDTINQQGTLYITGGALRDYSLYSNFVYPELDFLVLGLSKSHLLRILKKFGKARYVGKSFRVIKFYPEENSQEVHDFSLPALHQDDSDSIESVTAKIPLEDDLASRDFTMNSMAFNLRNKELIDQYGGVKDIEHKIIRMVRQDAFEKDPIRVIRAIRFSAQFGLEIEQNTLNTLTENYESVNNMAIERIRDELVKILLRCDTPSTAFSTMGEIGLLELILPELFHCNGVSQPGGRHKHDVFIHSLKTVDYAPKDLTIRLSALFHDVGKPPRRFVPEDGRARFYGHQELSNKIARRRLSQLKFPKKIIKNVSILISNHMFTHKVTQKGVRRLIRKVGEELIPALFQLRYADMKAQNIKLSLKEEIEFEKRVMDEINKRPPITVRDLDIDGNLIMEAFDLQPGKLIGKIEEYLIEKVLENPELNKKEKLLELAKIFLDYFEENN